MADAFAVTDNVANIWRPLTPAEEIVVATRLDQASAMIRAAVPDIDSRIVSGTLDRAVVAGVAADMVRRVMINPTAVRQRSQSIDDYQESETVDSSVSEGALYLSPRELTLLLGRRSRAFTIMPSAGPRWRH